MARFPVRSGRSVPAAMAAAIVLIVALMVVLTGCASLPGRLKTGPGVSDTTITLSVLTDLSGSFAPFGRAVTAAARVYCDQLNASGGICGRQIELAVRDHGYNVDQAQGLYADLEPQVLGFEQLLGSPMTSALLDRIAADQVLTAPASAGSALLENPYIAVMGTSYDVELIDAVEYLRAAVGLKAGDVIGHVYQDSEYGLEGALGSRYVAQQLGLKLVELRIDPDQTDLTDQVATLSQDRVKAVLLTTSPQQTAAIVGAAAATGLRVPFAGNNPTFTAQLLATPAGPALVRLFLLMGPSAAYSSDTAAVHSVVAAPRAADPTGAPDNASIYGWAVARAYADILRRACADGNLTRAGVAVAFHRTSDLSMDGLMPDLDFSRPGSPATRQVFVCRPDPSLPGGLRVLAVRYTSPLALSYKAPGQS